MSEFKIDIDVDSIPNDAKVVVIKYDFQGHMNAEDAYRSMFEYVVELFKDTGIKVLFIPHGFDLSYLTKDELIQLHEK